MPLGVGVGLGSGIRKDAGGKGIVTVVEVAATEPVLRAQVMIDLGQKVVARQAIYVIRAEVVCSDHVVGWPVGQRIKRQQVRSDGIDTVLGNHVSGKLRAPAAGR